MGGCNFLKWTFSRDWVWPWEIKNMFFLLTTTTLLSLIDSLTRNHGISEHEHTRKLIAKLEPCPR